MTARCCALFTIIIELIFLTLFLIFLSKDGGTIIIGNLIGYMLLAIPNILILVGILKENSLNILKWGVYLKAGFDSLIGIFFIIMVAFCSSLVQEDPRLKEAGPHADSFCIFLGVLFLLPSAWAIWALWAANAYYLDTTGVKVLPCCCGSSTGGTVPMMMLPVGNVVMYTPSGQPIYGPPGSAVMMQPSQGQLNQQQQMMMMQQQQQQEEEQ